MNRVELNVNGHIVEYNPADPASVRRVEAMVSERYGSAIPVAPERRTRRRRILDRVLPGRARRAV